MRLASVFPKTLGMERDELKQRLKVLMIEGLKLEDKRPDDIEDAAPIFVEGLGLDSIDALADFILAARPGAAA